MLDHYPARSSCAEKLNSKSDQLSCEAGVKCQAVLSWEHSSPACLTTAMSPGWDPHSHGAPHSHVTSLIRLTRAFWSKATASAHWCRWSWYRRQSCSTCWESSFSSLALVGEVCPLKSPLEERNGNSVMRNTADELVTNLAEVHGVRENSFHFASSALCRWTSLHPWSLYLLWSPSHLSAAFFCPVLPVHYFLSLLYTRGSEE